MVAVSWKRGHGGFNGLDDRIRYLGIAKHIWLGGDAPSAGDPNLERNDKGDAVEDLQNELIEAGFKVVADGEFGENTEEAVKAFQAREGLKVDGKVGPKTWEKLRANK